MNEHATNAAQQPQFTIQGEKWTLAQEKIIAHTQAMNIAAHVFQGTAATSSDFLSFVNDIKATIIESGADCCAMRAEAIEANQSGGHGKH